MTTIETEKESKSTGLFFRLHQEGKCEKKDLQAAAQLALQVEFMTIPAYLTALYSISDTGSQVYQSLRSVVMEEMFHVNQIANIIVALGALPRFTGDAAPKYPGYLPKANQNTTPLIGLYRATPGVFGSVFAAIENPAPYKSPPQGDNYDSIAQLYDALKMAVEKDPGNPFDNNGPGRQRTEIYLGKFGGKVIEVKDKSTFSKAVEQIVRQGEGTVSIEGLLLQVQPYGIYNHYGNRSDGTYGPILGTPYEMSHFLKFRHIALEMGNFPPTFPIISNPNSNDYTNAQAKQLSDMFDDHYTIMLQAFEAAFTEKLSDDHSYFSIVLTLMHQVLPNLSKALMLTPAFIDGDKSVGPNASPAWLFKSGPICDLTCLTQKLEHEIHQISNSRSERELYNHLNAALAGDKEILAAIKD